MNRRRRSTSCSPGPISRGGGGRSRSVGGRSVCAIVEEVGGEDVMSGAVGGGNSGGGDVAVQDDVFEDAVENSGGNSGESGEEGISLLEVSNMGGGDVSVPGNANAEGGEGEMEVFGGEGGEVDAKPKVEEGGDRDVGANMNEGGGVVEGGGENIGIGGGDETGVDNGAVGGGEFGGADDGDGQEIGGDIGVEPIPLIPRWRLRDILAHAEGGCNVRGASVYFVCVYRIRTVQRLLGLVLPFGQQHTRSSSKDW